MPSIFISYRREDAAGHAGHLAAELSLRYGESSVFIDIDAIAPGVDFERRIDDALSSCQVALVLIGDEWLTAERDGKRRIAQENDYVRREVGAALLRDDVTVIPVLIEGAQMPSAAELPADIAPLAKINALELSNKRWRYDLGRLYDVVGRSDPKWKRVLRATPRWAKRASPVAVVAGAAAAAVLLLSGGGENAAARIAACEHTHGLTSARQQRLTRPGESQVHRSDIVPGAGGSITFRQRTFASCSWPPPSGADPDGYSAITVTTTNGPGEFEASGRDLADRIESSCLRLELEYSFAHMATQRRFPPFQPSPGTIWAMVGPTLSSIHFHRIAEIGTASGDRVRLPFYPSADEVAVLHSGDAVLEHAQCA